MSSRTRLSFNVKLNEAGETIKIQIADPSNVQADNLALATWGSSEVLANILHRITVNISGTGASPAALPVLELGAGTGLVGLSAAAIWHTNAVLSDLAPILPNIQANVQLNSELLSRYNGKAVCGMLDWANPELLTFSSPQRSAAVLEAEPAVGVPQYNANRSCARVILAADTVYDEDHPELLVNVVKARLDTGPEARLIMCYPLRIGYLDHIRDLWERLEKAGLTCMQEGRETIDQSWDEDTPYEWCVWRWQAVNEHADVGK